MRKLTFISLCLLFTIPCGAATITVEAPQPVSLTIEADDFSAGTDISTANDDITLSYNGGPVYAVTSTKANGQLGTNVIAHSLGDELWGPDEQFKIDFVSGAKSVTIEVIASSDSTGWVTARIEAYNSDGELIDSDEETQIHKDYTHTFSIGREYFDIAYVVVYADTPGRYMCLDNVRVNFLPVYDGPADFGRIQDAIDYGAFYGDVIEVWPGTYYEGINFYGLAVTVTSIDPEDPDIVASTVIDAMGGDVGVKFSSLEDSSSVLTGLTIQNANNGIYCHYSDPLISNCVMKNNSVAGIYCNFSSPTIVNCIIEQNPGAGIMGSQGEETASESYPWITNCVIRDNAGNGVELIGGDIENCTISDNLSNGLKNCSAFVKNCIISGNWQDGIHSGGGTGIPDYPALILNCTIVGNRGCGANGAIMSLKNSIITENLSFGANNVEAGRATGYEGITFYAVACGISNYQWEEISELPFSSGDARAFKDALLEWPNWPKWEEENITLLLDNDANKGDIQAAIQDMAAAADEDDVCVFYFSGYGGAGPDFFPYDESDGHDEFLCAYDFQWSEQGQLLGAITDDELGDWMAALPTQKYAVFLDTSHSGGHIDDAIEGLTVMGIGDFVPAKDDGFATDLTAKMRGKKSRPAKAKKDRGEIITQDLDDNGYGVVVTSSAEDELSYQSENLQHSIFTYFLLEGMAGPADVSNNDRISAEECYMYAAPRTTMYLSRQHPQIYDGHPGELELLVWDEGVIHMNVLWYNNIWGNLAGSYSNVRPGLNDIHRYPLFAVDGYWDGDVWVEGDYHLKSSAGRWDLALGDWVIDDVNSPCIDAGDPEYPIVSEPNPNGARVNMGTYGGTTEASKSPSGIAEPVCLRQPAMDFNGDCKVNLVDCAMFTQDWLECNMDPQEACWE